jgi:hypothetical protein
MKIKTLYDIHNFANWLEYRLPGGGVPTNVSVRIDLEQQNWLDLRNELSRLTIPEENISSGLGWYSYQYMNVKFYIYLKQGE